ncbi:serine/threonine protein kinase [Alienimonas californiensis]|uniref:non-specific serine/threonine protein kinase n=1 Tax=Alienimonas californiensis TaxID=2527989 RepID=A0A517P683_9PLAN|nr:serine/threonine-protein kinase [Alienimonas californiensis]QDT14898.1 Serine/threonine-protein kinase PknB [Alienimonas californiensis]
MPRPVPETIGPYELGEVLGRGTVGTVYRAVNKETGKAWALKILLPQVSADAEISARFEREIEILEKLSHPNVVGCEASGKTPASDPAGARWYYVMELVEGGTLANLLRVKRVLDWEDVVELGWQLCSALQHLHNNGVVHRDLKPSNVYFTEDGVVKLGDFGIALDTANSALTEQGKTVGTWLYMSPEQIRGQNLDDKTDLYALGCLLYECLTGRPPFTGAGFADIFEQHLRRSPVPVKKVCGLVPTDLDAVVSELLEKDPKKRPLNARAVQGRLAEALMRKEERALERDDRRANRRREQKVSSQGGKGRTTPDIWALDPPRRALGGLLAEVREQPGDRQAGWGTVAMILGVTVALLALGALLAGQG